MSQGDQNYQSTTWTFPKRLLDLERALGLAIGAIEMVKICPHDFNKEGLDKVLADLKKVAESNGESGD